MLRWSVVDPRELVRSSVCVVTRRGLGYTDPAKRDEWLGTLSDRRMGACLRGEKCATCDRAIMDCHGHFGVLFLSTPVVPDHFVDFVKRVLHSVCWQRSGDGERCTGVFTTDVFGDKFTTRCDTCGGPRHAVTFKVPTFTVRVYGKKRSLVDSVTLSANQVRDWMGMNRGVTRIGLKFNPQFCVVSALPVLPPRARPYINDHEFKWQVNVGSPTTHYDAIIGASLEYMRALENESIDVITTAEVALWRAVNALMIAEDVTHGKKKQVECGIWNRLGSKEGRMRQNLMGTRSDFTSRAVLIGDPNLRVDQFGIPKVIASKLTVPVAVNRINWSECLKMAVDGRVARIVTADGLTVRVDDTDRRAMHVVPGSVIHRYLQDGDTIIMNRQPSLHKGSTMSFDAKIVPGHCLRISNGVAIPYNADFDGDEMNGQVPQLQEAIAETRVLLSIHANAQSTNSSAPMYGAIADTVLGCYLITRRDVLMTRADACTFLNDAGMMHRLPPPCVFTRGRALWSGTSLLSRLLPDDFCYGLPADFTEDARSVYAVDGELLHGRVTGAHVGRQRNSFIEIIHRMHGSTASVDFITNIQRAVGKWIMRRGFTITLRDFYVPRLQIYRSEYREALRDVMDDVYASEDMVLQKLNGARDKIVKKILDDIDRDSNSLCNMIDAQSKGKESNIGSMCFAMGQQSVTKPLVALIEGKRVTYAQRKGANDPASRGNVSSSLFNGLDADEFYFHCMATRKAICDMNMNTSDVGYMLRQIGASSNNVSVAYDNTVRRNNREIVQWRYAGHGYAPEKLFEYEPWLGVSRRCAKWRGSSVLPAETAELDACAALLGHAAPFDPGVVERSVQSRWEPIMCVMDAREIYDCVRATLRWTRDDLRVDPGFALACHFFSSGSVAARCWTKAQLQRALDEVKNRIDRGRVEWGTPVGMIAAQGVGEPLQQNMMRTFHNAGKLSTETMGSGRLQELLKCTKIDDVVIMRLYPSKVTPKTLAASLRRVRLSTTLVHRRIVVRRTSAWQTESATLPTWEWIYMSCFNVERLPAYYAELEFNDAKLTAYCVGLRFMADRLRSLGFEVTHTHENVDGFRMTCPCFMRVYHDDLNTLTSMLKSNPLFVRGRKGFDSFDVRIETDHVAVVIERKKNKTMRVPLVRTFNMDLLHDMTFCSSVMDTYYYYGIDAARNLLLDELRRVTSNSATSDAHVMLFADILTYYGTPVGVSSHGIVARSRCALSQLMYERVREFSTSAALRSVLDPVDDVASSIAIGREMPIGTHASFEVIDTSPPIEQQNGRDLLPKPRPSTYDPTQNTSYSPTYVPSSPAYQPSSPAYQPSSPAYQPSSPAYQPSSPAYQPSSPVYAPYSPTHEPASPAATYEPAFHMSKTESSA